MTATPRPGTLGDRIRRAAGLDPDEVDVDHLLEEHRAATDELRRLRSLVAELEGRLRDLENALAVSEAKRKAGVR